MSIELTGERDAILQIGEATCGECLSCGETRDVSPLTIVRPPREPTGEAGYADTEGHVDTVHICGRCLLAALVIHLAAQLVTEAGSMSAIDGIGATAS